MQRQTVEPHANEILAPKKIWKALDELQAHYYARDKSRVHWTTLCSPVSALHDELLISSQTDKKKNSKCAVLWKERQQYACTQSKIIKIIRKKNCPLFLCMKPDFTTNWRCRLFFKWYHLGQHGLPVELFHVSTCYNSLSGNLPME